jgi:hypothetical protein
MDLWLEILAAQLSATAPVLALRPVEEDWVDLIVGDPTPAQLYCILATRRKIPYTTDIPYSFDNDFLTRARRFIGTDRAERDRRGAVVRPAANP